MKSPSEFFTTLKMQIKDEWKTAFFSAVILGLLIHMPMLIQDIPNHDGLASMYFDQNMITSGRWFLMVACGMSSYFTLPWLIGLLAVLWLSLASAALTEFLEIHNRCMIVLISGLLVSFPSIASTFSYVFTMDGYMLALLLAVTAVLLTKKSRMGFLPGAICLAFSLGIYQAYLPFAALLSIYGILMLCMEHGPVRDKIRYSLRYLYMGITGLGLYYIILQVLLKIQGKVLDTYQGINGMGSVEKAGIIDTIKNIYMDFFSFTIKGNVLFQNVYSFAAVILLVLLVVGALIWLAVRRKYYKSIWFYLILVLLAAGLPVATNLILVISPEVTYHLLMRYQWVLYLILGAAFLDKVLEKGAIGSLMSWGVVISLSVLSFHYAVTDNIAYSNLQKKYEKTYSYCLRLLDRIEQTEGYYQGIPIAMIGVVGNEPYPETDITGKVTSNMIGMYGDSLLYTGANYQAFIKHYLGATLNVLPAEAMAEIYYSEEYMEMESFPGRDAARVVDGILYVKTENMEKDK